ncbi:Protein Mpv17 [Desmophyllum pertusum]|uniref:Mitochondrial inner membrane protein Mpv17 n=1 Tax=Desmophyllum pertusum TaxID=174260 RepID=A0A9W9YLB9_9CNID|nr:Protein Mpv17 [Desmophyllum pertusum]
MENTAHIYRGPSRSRRFIAQQCVEKVPLRDHDMVRTARMAAIGNRGDRANIPRLVRGTRQAFVHKSPGNAMRKMTVDQSILAPVFLILFYGIVGIVERRTVKQISDKIYEEFYPNMVVNYKIWPAVQFLNFYLFPAHLRVLVVNVVSLFWNTYLAWTSHKELGHSTE